MTASASPRSPELSHGVRAILALGANLGDRESTLCSAIETLGAVPGVLVEAVSPLFETPALKLSGVDRTAPAYRNIVARVRTTLEPYALLEVVNRIEADHGRVREERWGARTLDIDIVDYDGRSNGDERLTLPHPRAADRAFVLVPWLAIEPEAVLPGHGSVAELAARATDEAVLSAPAPPLP